MDEGEGEGEGGSEKCSRYSALSLCQRVHVTSHDVTSMQTIHCGWIRSEASLMDLGPVVSLDSR